MRKLGHLESSATSGPTAIPPMKLAWWLHPIVIFVGLNGVTAVVAFLAEPRTYLELWRTPKYFNGTAALLTFGMIAAFTIGAWLGVANLKGLHTQGEWDGTVLFSSASLLFRISFWVCILAYVIWVAVGISRGLGLSVLKAALLDGGAGVLAFKEFLPTVPGVTTCTQFGIAAVVLGCLIGANVGWKTVWRKLAILFVLALVRAVLHSERLAFLELAIPFMVLWIAAPRSWARSRSARYLVRLAPLLGAAGVYVVFTAFEYIRSWSVYYSARESSLFLFGFWRLFGYYVTSVNNSAYLISNFPHAVGAPYFSASFLWQFPFLNEYVKDLFSWVHLDYSNYMALLAVGANPEFNNWGGLLSPVVDFGVLGGLEYWIIMGLVTGYLYRLFARRHPLGLCMYPVTFLALTEIPRYLYWGEGRAFPALAFLLFSSIFLLRSATLHHSFERLRLAADSNTRSLANTSG